MAEPEGPPQRVRCQKKRPNVLYDMEPLNTEHQPGTRLYPQNIKPEIPGNPLLPHCGGPSTRTAGPTENGTYQKLRPSMEYLPTKFGTPSSQRENSTADLT